MAKYIIGYGNGDLHFDGSPYVEWNGDVFNTFKEAEQAALEKHKQELLFQKEERGGVDEDTYTYVGKLPADGCRSNAKIVLSVQGSKSEIYDWE